MKPQAVANFIGNSKTTQRVLRGINNNPAICTAGATFIFASILRPSLIGIMPFKEDKDKKYSQASSIAAGLIDLIMTAAIFIPLNKSIGKAAENLTGDVFASSKTKEQFKSLTNRGLKMLSLAPSSFARFSLVRPIVDKFFNKKEDNMLSRKGRKWA